MGRGNIYPDSKKRTREKQRRNQRKGHRKKIDSSSSPPLSSDKVCAKCGKRTNLTKHHIYPKRYGGSSQNANIRVLCRDPCHDELERLIQNAETDNRGKRTRLPKSVYTALYTAYVI